MTKTLSYKKQHVYYTIGNSKTCMQCLAMHGYPYINVVLVNAYKF